MINALRAWARGHTRRRRYSPVGVAFHWTMAALILFQLAWGFRLGHLPAGYDKLAAYDLHWQVGLLILVLALLRIGWRLMVPGPINDADKPGWQAWMAHLTHFVFYFCFLALPISGWLMVSATAREQSLSLLGLPWPQLPLQGLAQEQRWLVEEVGEQIHFGVVIALLVLLPIHVGGAVLHHVVHRHDVLEGMLPGITRLERGMLRVWRGSPPAPGSPRGSDAG